MKYTVDEKVVQKFGLTLPQVFALLSLKASKQGVKLKDIFDELRTKEAIVTYDDVDYITQHWNDVCDDILLTSKKYIPSNEELEPLAEELRSIFPQGKKEGTPYYWKCNKREVILKLKSFYELYGLTYSHEQIINAARRYVASYNGDYRFMRLLKYFIWKKEDGIESSDLATFIDNEDQDDENTNWVTELT